VTDFPVYAKEVSKSGIIKFICSVYLPQILGNKINMHRTLKLLKIVAGSDRSVLPGREKNIALVIYQVPPTLLMVQ
jgi:hypothetical protein